MNANGNHNISLCTLRVAHADALLLISLRLWSSARQRVIPSIQTVAQADGGGIAGTVSQLYGAFLRNPPCRLPRHSHTDEPLHLLAFCMAFRQCDDAVARQRMGEPAAFRQAYRQLGGILSDHISTVVFVAVKGFAHSIAHCARNTVYGVCRPCGAKGVSYFPQNHPPA